MNTTVIVIVATHYTELYKNFCNIRDLLVKETNEDVKCHMGTTGIIQTNGFYILFYPDEYIESTQGLACDYFAITSACNPYIYKKWQYQLASSGKELTSFHEVKEKIMEGIGMKKSWSIKNVIFNDPAVIVIWDDNSKTVVKCGKNDVYDPEKGLAMAISKKALGNQGNYYDIFKKWLTINAASADSTEKTHKIGNNIKHGFANSLKIADATDRVSEFLDNLGRKDLELFISTTVHDDEGKNNG